MGPRSSASPWVIPWGNTHPPRFIARVTRASLGLDARPSACDGALVSGPSRRALYITYDGLEEPLGRSQVLPYVLGLAERGHSFEVLSFEKPGVPLRGREPIAPRVRWTALRYHRRPTAPATAFDIASGALAGAVARLARGVDLVHARSYVAATMGLAAARGLGVPLLFDTRGLWPDEKVDGGAWPAGGALYQAAKRAERALLREADAITTLTHSMQRYLRDEYPHRDEVAAPIRVIPTCTDLATFHPGVVPDAALSAELRGARALLYLGSIGTWYMSREMARLYLAWRREVPSARLLVVSREQPDEMREVLAAAGVAHELVHRSARREQVAPYARCAVAAVCFVRPSFSKRGSAPTKLGELLGCGLPVAANVVGDMATVLAGTDAGVVVDDMSDEGLGAAASKLAALAVRADVAQVAHADAVRWFRLDTAVDAYDRLYRAMPRRHGERAALVDGGWPP